MNEIIKEINELKKSLQKLKEDALKLRGIKLVIVRKEISKKGFVSYKHRKDSFEQKED